MKKLTTLAPFCFLFFAFSLLPFALKSQAPAKPNSADILQSIKKLQVLGSVVFVAAHPDDENTRLISYLASERLFNVTYLSFTRGDGGQNLIGPEMRELLGVIRTEELLAARRVDGGKQLFSRANDYGYSKKPSEAFKIWNRDEVLADAVWAFRKCRPDVVINRFTADTSFENHGHHTASAILGIEAFDLANRKDFLPEQFKFGVEPWQPRRIFFNTSWWFYGSREKFDAADKSNLAMLDLGVFLPLKGKSNNEVAAESRSMHRCQGFGSSGTRGEQLDYFQLLKEAPPGAPGGGESKRRDAPLADSSPPSGGPGGADPFSGINTTWTREPGGEKIGQFLAEIERNFRFDNPSASVADLLKAQEMIQKLPDSFWKQQKSADIKEVIKHCLGIFIEAVAADATGTPGEKIKVKLELINRSKVAATLDGFSIQPALFDTTTALNLPVNKSVFFEKFIQIPENAASTSPYWLTENFDIGMYKVADQMLRGLPETPRFARVKWRLKIGETPIDYETDIVFKKEIPERGEIYQPFEVLPPVVLEVAEPVYIFHEKGAAGKKVEVVVQANRADLSGSVALDLPKGWRAEPASQPFEIKKKGQSKSLIFNVLPPSGESDGRVKAIATINGKAWGQRLVSIAYEHIPTQSVLLEASARVVRLDVKTTAHRIGYYMGAGDEVPQSLRQIGCEVTLLGESDLGADNLRQFDAIVVGIRAYNAKDAIVFDHEKLLEYCKNGGNLVLQYNTTGDLSIKEPAPFKLKIGRDRVTLEDAPVRFLKPDHAVLNSPNKISQRDFDGWVQERGLYFPSEWGPEFEAVLSMNDPGETPKDGSLLVAKYGEGHFIYTGLSFFRELPMGVPGAYRLFANLISVGKSFP